MNADGQLSDAWWEALGPHALHPVQVKIIEALRSSGKPLHVLELRQRIDGVVWPVIEKHLRVLTGLGAVALVDRPARLHLLARYRLLVDESNGGDQDSVAVRFGKNLRAYREHARLSQKELIFRASIYGTEIDSLERGDREPRLGEVVRLASALSVSIEDLLAGIEWMAGGGRFEVADLHADQE